MIPDHDFSIAVQLLLIAMTDEDSERANCEGLDGVALFLALGARDSAVELRKGHMRAVQRMLGQVAAQGSAIQDSAAKKEEKV